MQSPNIQSQPVINQGLSSKEGVTVNVPVQNPSNLPPQKISTTKNNFLTFTIVFGILSMTVSILSPCGMLFGIIGTIFGFKAREITENNSLAKIGIALNIVGLILSLIFAILYGIVLSTPELLK